MVRVRTSQRRFGGEPEDVRLDVLVALVARSEAELAAMLVAILRALIGRSRRPI